VSLLVTLIVAKTITLILLRDAVVWSPWFAIAYYWQDVLLALAFYAADRLVKRPLASWTVYGLTAIYAAVNVPVAAALSSPLTPTLMRASGGALADSIRHYFTVTNVTALALPLVVAIATPMMLARVIAAATRRVRLGVVIVALALVAVAPYAMARTDTRGFHRNAIGALVEASVPRVGRAHHELAWRASPFDQLRAEPDRRSSLAGIARGRNVVLIALESTAARYLGLYGARPDPAPNLSTLSNNALVFDRAYSVYPESIKGLFAVLCSRYPAFDTDPELYAQAACEPLPTMLATNGYKTALFHSGRFDYLGMRAIVERRGFDTLEDAGAIGGNVHSSFGVDEPATVRRILAWIDGLPKESRFFLTYLPVAAHHPYATNGPRSFPGTTDFDNYLNAIHEGDESLGTLIDGLRARGLDRNTLWVVFGDHGEAFGQHPGNFAHTLFVYDENIRVPMVIAAPGAIAGMTRMPAAASVVDIAPTIADLLGLQSSRMHDGTSLLVPGNRVSYFFTDYALGWLGLVDGCWKYLLEVESDRSRLFDVCVDANEHIDRAADERDRVSAYRDRVRKWAQSVKSRF
jgi:Sulfatase